MTHETLLLFLRKAADLYEEGGVEKFISLGGIEVVTGAYGAWLGSRETEEDILREIQRTQKIAIDALTLYEDFLYRNGQHKQDWRILLFLLSKDVASTPLPASEKSLEVLDPTRTDQYKPGELVEAFYALHEFLTFKGAEEQQRAKAIHLYSELSDVFHNLMQMESIFSDDAPDDLVLIENELINRVHPDEKSIAREFLVDCRNVALYKYSSRYVNPDGTVRESSNKDPLVEEVIIKDMFGRYDMDYYDFISSNINLIVEMLMILRDILEEKLQVILPEEEEIKKQVISKIELYSILSHHTH